MVGTEFLGGYAWILENEYSRAALIVLIALIVAKLFQFVLIGIFKRLTAKTETDIDDIILKIASRPVFYLILLAGLYFAERSLTVFDNYEKVVTGVFFVLGVLIVAWMGSRIFALLTTRWFKSHRDVDGSPRLINIIAAVVIYVIAFIVVLSHFHIEITPFLAALGVGGLAVGLALQDTLGNVFAGIHLISDQPVRVGDIVEVRGEDLVGTVEDIGWRSTRIRTFTNNLVIVPNAKLAGSILTNFEMPEKPMRVSVECGVDYGSDMKKVERAAMDVARKIQKIEGGDPKWEPLIRFHTFADSNINFRVILQAKTRGDTFLITHEFMKALHAEFGKRGIEISWPVRKVYGMNPPRKKK